MTKYIINVTDIPNQGITISYNADGRLILWDATEATSYTTVQLQWLKANVPVQLDMPMDQFTELIAKAKGAIAITQSTYDVSFDTFWNAYDNKLHKKDAENLYNRLSYADKVTCIASCEPYRRYCQRKGEWYNQQLPDTYISKRNFETDWRKVK